MTVREFLNSILDCKLKNVCWAALALLLTRKVVSILIEDPELAVPFQIIGFLAVSSVIGFVAKKSRKASKKQ